MDAQEAISEIHKAQNVMAAVYTTLHMTAYLFPPHATVKDGDTFDYIVVGAGSAGSVIANRLTENPDITLLLLEAGGDPPLESVLPAYMDLLKKTRFDWNYTSADDPTLYGHKNETIEMTRGRMLGGCSSNNLMMYVRGSPHDFNTWADIVNDRSWSYRNILPYFKKSENLQDEAVLKSPYRVFHGTHGNLGVTKPSFNLSVKYLKSFEELGHDIVLDTTGSTNLGYTESMFTIAHGVRQSTAYSFLRPIKNRLNFFLAKYTLVTKIIFDKNNKAIGVKAINQDNTTITLYAKKEIILSAGAINTPQLLMLSGIGPKKHLRSMGIDVIADLPVGENLQDHSPVLQIYPTENQGAQLPKSPHEIKSPNIAGYVASNKFQKYPDYQTISMIVNEQGLLKMCAFAFAYKNKICQQFYEESRGKEIFYTLTVPLHPKSRGRILLRSLNPKEHPYIDLGVYTNETDLEDAAKYIEDVNRITGTKYFQSVNAKMLVPTCCKDIEPGSKDYWLCHARCMVTTIYHYVGTCAMGMVVDSQLRVYDVEGLRVADGSIMPTITSGNTNAPIIMIGEKAADMIKEDYKKYL